MVLNPFCGVGYRFGGGEMTDQARELGIKMLLAIKDTLDERSARIFLDDYFRHRSSEALAAERKRTVEECAKIAESYVVKPTMYPTQQRYRDECMQGIADKIRGLGE
jgi:hypothetical protein